MRAVLCGPGLAATWSIADLHRDGGSQMSHADGLDPRQVVRHDVVPPAIPDPLRLCVAATVALLGWLLGPIALVLDLGPWRLW